MPSASKRTKTNEFGTFDYEAVILLNLTGINLAADSSQGCEGGVIGCGQSVQVLVRGGDVCVPEPFTHHSEIGAAGEQPGRVRVSQVVQARSRLELRLLACWIPDVEAEPVTGEVPVAVSVAFAAR